MTVGFVIVSAAARSTGRLSTHERHHIKQYSALGPFFLPLYFGLAIRYGYQAPPDGDPREAGRGRVAR